MTSPSPRHTPASTSTGGTGAETYLDIIADFGGQIPPLDQLTPQHSKLITAAFHAIAVRDTLNQVKAELDEAIADAWEQRYHPRHDIRRIAKFATDFDHAQDRVCAAHDRIVTLIHTLGTTEHRPAGLGTAA